MEADKENMNRQKLKTKIPLPLEPLPALPKHLLKENKTKQDSVENVRHPLRTLKQVDMNSQGPNNIPNIVNQAGPSKKVQTSTARKSIKIDARHVTLRHKSEDLDWDYKVFKDNIRSNNSIISISDDEDYLNEKASKEFRFFAKNKQRNCLGESKVAVTPALKNLEPNRVKNIKRSLKRPHSRELQGLSPVGKQEKKGDEKIRKRLRFNDSLQDRLQSPDFLKKSYMRCLTRDYAPDVFTYLLNVEKKPVDVPKLPSLTRACVVNWLIKINGPDGNPAVIQTACWYLDSILGTGEVRLDKLQLVAAACYWIAQKLHGPAVCGARLVKCANNAFTSEKLLAVEKAVMNRLKFPTQPVVPQDYITYFSWYCDNDHPGEIEVAASFLCTAGIMVDKVLCTEYPSAIGAAAVRNALLLLRKRDLMIRLQMCPVFRAAEKKASNLQYVSSVLRKAVRTASAPLYEYRAPFEQYGLPPHYIAQRIVNAATDLAIMDARNTAKRS